MTESEPRAAWRRVLTNVVLVSVPTVLLFFGFGEVVFRSTIPASEQPFWRFNPRSGVLKFDTARSRKGTFTRGELAQIQGKWRINDAGWNSPVEYDSAGESPLIAVIGDSYIEGFHVGQGNRLPDLLRGALGSIRVYSFGISGASLSQYLHLLREEVSPYDPDLVVITIVHNDFHESIRFVHGDPYHVRPHFLQFAYDRKDGLTELGVESPGRVSFLRSLVRKSAFARYLTLNLAARKHVTNFVEALSQKLGPGRTDTTVLLEDDADTHFEANINPARALSIKEIIEEATDYIVRELQKTVPEAEILLLMDAPRSKIYEGALETSRVYWLNEILANSADKVGVHHLDLTPVFWREHREKRKQFEFPTDWHWNEHGHQVAAEAVLDYIRKRGLVPSQAIKRESINAKTEPVSSGFTPVVP